MSERETSKSNEILVKLPEEFEAKLSPQCPICGKDRALKYRPFCSKHCADVDLNRWFTESYALPAADDAEDNLEDEI